MEATEAEGDEEILPEDEVGEDADKIFEEEARSGGSPSTQRYPVQERQEPVDYRKKRTWVVSTWEKEKLKNYPALLLPISQSEGGTRPVAPRPNTSAPSSSSSGGQRRSWTQKKDQTPTLEGIEKNYAFLRSNTVSLMQTTSKNNTASNQGAGELDKKGGGKEEGDKHESYREGRDGGTKEKEEQDAAPHKEKEKGEGSKRKGHEGSTRKKKSSLKRAAGKKEVAENPEAEGGGGGSKKVKKAGGSSRKEEKEAKGGGSSRRGGGDETLTTPMSVSADSKKVARGRSQTQMATTPMSFSAGESGVGEEGRGSLRIFTNKGGDGVGGSLRGGEKVTRRESKEGYLYLAKAIKTHTVKGNKGVGEIYKELEFHKGDTIGVLIEENKEGMLFGEIHHKQGWFPASYVQKYI